MIKLLLLTALIGFSSLTQASAFNPNESQNRIQSTTTTNVCFWLAGLRVCR